ncbi:hypothetical protein CFIMG_004855RA [Ceratocystis fimbriata CBS 114723]|uniref:Uncharacterized protein n=1 Tax=Ceratocystis fimbriata CBS 114723 TaxID=1035309 RepID=A0A2C5X764_9PEZI|nr:hypothetical protein CFIMG_004855RA [Ceratocystis fimbriata CBS 114723]
MERTRQLKTTGATIHKKGHNATPESQPNLPVFTAAKGLESIPQEAHVIRATPFFVAFHPSAGGSAAPTPHHDHDDLAGHPSTNSIPPSHHPTIPPSHHCISLIHSAVATANACLAARRFAESSDLGRIDFGPKPKPKLKLKST